MADGDGSLDYFETVQMLNSWAEEFVIVYPVAESLEGPEPSESDFIGGLSVWGTFKPQGDPGAAVRRSLSSVFERTQPELAIGDAPLELYERQAAGYTFEGMDDLHRSYVGFVLWQHSFIESRWLDIGGRFHWLWIRARPLGFVVAEEFQTLQALSDSDG